MYLTQLKTVLVQGLRNTFDGGYPVTEFANLPVSLEYPVLQTDYPGVWVDFEPMGNLSRGGVDNILYATDPVSLESRALSIWRFQGYATYTLIALHSFERDRLFDEVVRVMAFSQESAETAQFRSFIEDNPYIALNIDFDNVGQRGTAASPGTPWGSQEIIYETTLVMEVVGEFVSDELSETLFPLAGISVEADDPLGGSLVTSMGHP